MPTITIVHHSPFPTGYDERTTVIVVSETGRTARSTYTQLQTVRPVVAGPSTVQGTPLTEQCTTGMIQIDRNGVALDDREFAAMSVSMRNQIAGLMTKGFLDVALDGVARTANQVRTFV
jgi:hypothetical protein